MTSGEISHGARRGVRLPANFKLKLEPAGDGGGSAAAGQPEVTFRVTVGSESFKFTGNSLRRPMPVTWNPGPGGSDVPGDT